MASRLLEITVGIPRDPRIVPEVERFAEIDYLWLVHNLKFDDRVLGAAIWRLQPKSDSALARRWQNPKIRGIRKMEYLSSDSGGSHLYYVEIEQKPGFLRFLGNVRGGKPYPAFELTPEWVKISWLGNKREVKSFLAQLNRTKAPYKVLSMGQARFSRETILQGTTSLQMRALRAAYSTGFLDVPRRITSERLAKLMGLDKSTLSIHLRKAEKRVIGNLLS